MSLLLCRQEHVKRPFYVESLGIHLYSIQELAYVIYHYPLLSLDDFINEGFLEFMRDELNQGFLALKIERWLKSSEDPDEVLSMILQESDYFTPAEMNRYRQQLAAIRKKHPAEYKKLKADELFSVRQYGRASRLYTELLEYPADSYVNEVFTARIWNNMGSCYARMFRMDKAMEAYARSYAIHPQPKVLEQMYCLTRLNQQLTLGSRFEALITAEMRQVWDADIQDAQEHAAAQEAVLQVEELFARDPIKRQAGEAQLLGRWKKEYRAMV